MQQRKSPLILSKCPHARDVLGRVGMGVEPEPGGPDKKIEREQVQGVEHGNQASSQVVMSGS